MRWRQVWQRGCAVVFTFAVASVAIAGPVNSSQSPVAKIKEIEDAGAELTKGNIDGALKLLEEAVKKKPDLAPARLMLARLLFSTREGHQQGRAQLELAARENPDHPEIYLTNATLANNEGRITDTILNCEKALQYCNNVRWTADQRRGFESQARQGLAASYENRRDWDHARTQLNALLEAEPRNGQLHARLAQALFFCGKTDDAFQELTQAQKDESALDPPTVAMAKLWAIKGDDKEARQWFDKAIKAEPNNIRVHLAYANWLLQQNLVGQAKIHVDAAYKNRPEDHDVQKMQGLIHRIQKELPAAEAIFKKIISDSPSDYFATNQLALILADAPKENKEARSRAVQYAEVNARANQRNAEALATLGYVYYQTNNLDDALKALQAAVSSGQAAPDTAYYLALVLYDREKTDEARKLLANALGAKGLFVYRDAAEALAKKIDKDKPKDSSKTPAKP